MASQLCIQTLFSSSICGISSYSDCSPIRKKSKRRFKKSFPNVLNNLSDSNNRRSSDTDERSWRRPFIYFAVFGVVNPTENERKSPKEIPIFVDQVWKILFQTASTCMLLMVASRRARKKIYAPISTASN